MKKYYKISNLNICIDAPEFPYHNSFWQAFEVSAQASESNQISISCEVCDTLPIPDSADCQFVKHSLNGQVSVYKKGNVIYRHTYMGKEQGALAVFESISSIKCFFTLKSFSVMADERYVLSSLCFPQLLLENACLYIHSSYININGNGIIFCGDCGIGKSTQARLWQEHRGAEIINGDKSIISFDDDKIFVNSLPACGTSGICLNKSLPLNAIVILSQGSENSAQVINGVDAIQKIIENIYLDFLSPGEQQLCIDLIIKILNKVSVISLTCTPDEKAIETLEDKLRIKN